MMSDERPTFSIKVNNPLTIEEQLMERSHNSKFMTIWFDQKGMLNMFTGAGLTYMEKLFIMDTIRQNIDRDQRANDDD